MRRSSLLDFKAYYIPTAVKVKRCRGTVTQIDQPTVAVGVLVCTAALVVRQLGFKIAAEHGGV